MQSMKATTYWKYLGITLLLVQCAGCCCHWPHKKGITLRGGLDFREHRKPAGFVELVDTEWDEKRRMEGLRWMENSGLEDCPPGAASSTQSPYTTVPSAPMMGESSTGETSPTPLPPNPQPETPSQVPPPAPPVEDSDVPTPMLEPEPEADLEASVIKGREISLTKSDSSRTDRQASLNTVRQSHHCDATGGPVATQPQVIQRSSHEAPAQKSVANGWLWAKP